MSRAAEPAGARSLVTDVTAALTEQIEATPGGRIAGLEGIGETPRDTPEGRSSGVRRRRSVGDAFAVRPWAVGSAGGPQSIERGC